jgi:hypothetical protein
MSFLLKKLKLFLNLIFRFSFEGVQFLKNLYLEIKSYGEMKILGEVWATRASAGASQQELTTSAQKSG